MWGRIISTHALTEGDAAGFSTSYPCFSFQLTPSRRATHSDLHSLDFLIYFNSRPHGGRPKATAICSVVDAFQLTPSRRATMQVLLLRSRTSNFNSRPHGGRPSQMIRSASYSYFNSRPHGGRLARATNRKGVTVFQLTPSRRATANLDKFFF